MATYFEYDFTKHGHETHNSVKSKIQTGIFIDNKFSPSSSQKTIPLINPSTGQQIGEVQEGTPEDVDRAVKVAERAYAESWGHRMPGNERAKLLIKLAELIERDIDELASLEALNNGKAFSIAKGFDIAQGAECLRYYGGWADKDHGKVIEVNPHKMAYTKHEPIGVVAQIIPWNFPFLMLCWKLGPALATGNTIILKPSEFTPLTALKTCELIVEAGFPPGVINIINGYGATVGNRLAEHPDIRKIAFTGSTAVGRKIMEVAAKTNLKTITLELGGKSPNIVTENADLAQAAAWAGFGIFLNHGQCCCAGSRVYVHEKVYDEFFKIFVELAKKQKVGDPFAKDTFQGPQISQIQFDRIMSYIDSGKEEGATCEMGGNRYGKDGYFIEPTIFTDVTPNMRISREEIFGPVVVLIKYKDEAEVIKAANDSEYGLAAAVFSQDLSQAMRLTDKLQAGTVWVNCYNMLNYNVPFGGYKTSGIGRELGEYALANYTEVKAVHINLDEKAPFV